MTPTVACRRSSRECLVNSEVSLFKVGLQYRVFPFDPCLYFVHRRDVGSVGAFTTRIEAILRSGELDFLSKTRVFMEAGVVVRAFGT